MKKKIPFVKYTSYGNNFVIVDETHTPVFSENGKIRFADRATDIYFGVGSDNFLVIQPCSKKVLDEINQAHSYWSETPEFDAVDFIFRMFEPDGTEAFSCGNGLMCIASYLFRRYNMDVVRIITEIPTAEPKVVTIGTLPEDSTSWANLGQPRKIPPDMFTPSVPKPYDDVIYLVDNLEISFRSHDLKPFSAENCLNLTAYLVFTGEPHLVVFPEKNGPLDGFEQVLFASSEHSVSSGKIIEKRINFGIWLVDQIGQRINSKYQTIFPAGMNINFARPVDSNNGETILEYRCFERGINRETLACGTGAMAVSYIYRRLNLIDSSKITILPYRCRLHHPDAQIHIDEDETGCRLHGYPAMLFEGDFEFDES